MGFNTDADKFWAALTWTTLIVLVGGTIWWGLTARTPDLPFQAWLDGASRDDVWGYLFGCIACGVGAGRILTRK